MWTKEARIQHAPREQRYPSDVTDHCVPVVAAASAWPASRDRHAGGHEHGALRAAYGMPVTTVVPKEFPPRSTVYNYFWEWTRYGVLDRIHHMLLVKVREMEGREASPTAAIIDTQAVKATEKGGLRKIRSVTTQQRKPRASSAMSSSIRSGCFSASR